MKKEFIGDCVNNPFASLETLSEIIDNAREITKKTFIKYCDVENDLRQDMKQFPNDYTFFKYQNIYFFTWSAIEHFYI